MSRILVVEKDAEFSNQLAVALRAQGHTIDAVASSEAGRQHAAARAPQLVLVSGMLPGAQDLLNRFSKRNGGPGSAVIVPAQMSSEISARQFGADMILPRPATGSALAKVLGLLPASQVGTGDPALLPDVGAQLTSQQIFGDVLAEVEADVDKRSSAPQPEPTPSTSSASAPSVSAPSQPKPSPPTPSAPAPSAPQALSRPPRPAAPGSSGAPGSAARSPSPPPRRRRADDDIDRKLEETLSGFFPDKLKAESEKTKKPKAPTKPRRAPSTDEIDDLLDKTLSSLELPRAAKKRSEPRPPASPRPSAPKQAAPKPAAPEPSAPTSQAPPQQPSKTQPPETRPAQAPAAPVTSAPTAPTSPAASSPAGPAPPPLSPPSPPDLPSAAETLRLDAPSAPPEEPRPAKPEREAEGPPASEFQEPPADALSPPALSQPTFTQEASPASSSWMPDNAGPAEEDILQTGTFDLPALEPLPEQPPPPFFESEPPAPGAEAETAPPPSIDGIDDDGHSPTVELSPPPPLLETEPSTAEAPEPPTPEPPASQPPPSFELPDLPPAEGWSVSSFEDEATPESPTAAPPELPEAPAPPADEADRTPSFAPPEVPSAFAEEPAPPASFEASDFGAQSFETPAPPSESATPPEPPAEDESYAYPTDFESAFALPAGEKEDGGFSPDPTETVEPEDTASLQRTLEGVLQIRNGSSASGKAGIPFGDYRLLDRVAVGGMAEVWRAHRRGVEGFQKIVAIKKILSHLTGSQDFITMFIDEAKLAAQLNHTNIIQIYDLGKVEDDFFIAMEFVDGKDLRSIQNRAKDEGVKLPIGLCLMITAAVARALDYAHRKRDFDNRDLGLVHRDVSPQNVLISYEGEIKLCDFGIVKAVAKASSTQMGALKGKLQYMSPEQAWGKEVDARSDIFSLGSVFFELLTGERLFTGDSEIGVLDAVRDCRVQSPRNLNPEVPVEVETIVMRALAATPETRYQTAGEMEKDIAAVLEQLRPAVGQSELADMMAELFGPHPSSAKAEIPPTGEPEPASRSHLDAEAAPDGEDAGKEPAKEAAKKEPKGEKKKRAKKKTDAGGGSRAWIIAAIVLVALAAVVAILFFALRGGDSAPSSPAPITAPADAGPSGAPPLDAPGSGEEGADDAGPGASGAVPGQGDGAAQAGTDEESTGQGDTAQDGTAEGAAAADQPPGGDADAQGQDESGADYQRLIQEALDSEKKKLEQDYEAERRRLEAELSKVRAEGEESEGGGGGDGEGGGG